jgi:hypothetical protein
MVGCDTLFPRFPTDDDNDDRPPPVDSFVVIACWFLSNFVDASSKARVIGGVTVPFADAMVMPPFEGGDLGFLRLIFRLGDRVDEVDVAAIDAVDRFKLLVSVFFLFVFSLSPASVKSRNSGDDCSILLC